MPDVCYGGLLCHRAVDRPPAPGRQPIGLLEVPRQVTLVGEAARRRGLGKPVARAQQRLCMVEPTQRQIAIRARSQAPAELAGEGEAVKAGHRLELMRCDDTVERRVEKLARPLDRDGATR